MGSIVGTSLGAGVGDTLGMAVGLQLGFVVGNDVLGMNEGDHVGVAVDGTGVGSPAVYVGTAVEGTAVDGTDVVGSAVGAGDGRTVGADVGK